MRKYYFIIALLFVAMAAINTSYFRSIYKMQVNQNKNFLFKQTDVCVNEIEKTLHEFESDLNYILFSDNISKLFSETESDGLRKLHMFYSTYDGLVQNIDIYDNNKNVLNIFRDTKQNFITDRFEAQRQRKLIAKEEIIIKKNEYQYVLPVFIDNELFANILVTINIHDFILSELNRFHLDDVTWQWVIDLDTKEITNTSNISYNWNGELETTVDELKKEHENILIHTISNDSLNHKILSVYTPIQVLNRNFGVALSIDHQSFLVSFYKKLAIIAGLSLLIFLFVSGYLINQIRLLKKKIND